MGKETGKLPEEKYRSGQVTATIWKNEAKNKDGDKYTFLTVSVQRNYMDKNEEWQKTSTMGIKDMHDVITVCQKAYEFAKLKEE